MANVLGADRYFIVLAPAFGDDAFGRVTSVGTHGDVSNTAIWRVEGQIGAPREQNAAEDNGSRTGHHRELP